MFKKFLWVLMWLGFMNMPQVVFAQISLEAQVDRQQLNLGESLQFSIVVNGTQKVAPFKLPDLDGFDVQYVGPTRNVSIVNGNYTSSITFNYSLLPTREGALTIPSQEVTIESVSYRTDAISIVVGGKQAGDEGSAKTLEDNIFLQIDAPKTPVYVNQAVPLTIYFYTAGVRVTDIQFPALDNVGFLEEDYTQPRQFQQNISERVFNVVEFKKTIYPTRTGTLSLGPAQLNSSLIVDAPRSRRNSVFDDPFFSNFFGRQEKRALSISSNEVTLDVKALPEAGQPDDFTGAVGRFAFEAELGPSSEVMVGDPLTLRLRISGKGQLQSIKFPDIDQQDDFKMYEPNISEEKNQKILEQVLIPRSTEVTELKALSFSYFDPYEETYKTIKKGPFPLHVKPAADGSSLKVIGGEPSRPLFQQEKIGEDIIFIKDDPGKIRQQDQRLYHRFIYWFLVVLFGLIYGGSFVYYRRTHRLETDSLYAQAQQAPKTAQAGLVQAQKYMHEKQGRAFYDIVHKTLVYYLGAKFALPAGNISTHQVAQKLPDKEQAQEVLKLLDALLQESEQIRYASGVITDKQMQTTYTCLHRVIQNIERITA